MILPIARGILTIALALALLSEDGTAQSVPSADDSASDARVSRLEALLEAQQRQLETQRGQIETQRGQLDALGSQVAATASQEPDAARLELMRQQIAELGDQVTDLDERVGSQTLVRAFDALHFTIGGFATATFATVRSDGDTESAFDLSRVELFIRASDGDKWSLFFVPAFESDTGLDLRDPGDISFGNFGGEVVLELAVVEYQHSDAWRFQLGRLQSPHGIINQEHFDPTLLHLPFPQFLRHGRPETIFPRFFNGAQALGSITLRDDADTLSYNMYVGSSDDSSDKFTAGGRAAYTFGESGVTAGFNLAYGTHGGRADQEEYNMIGADLLVDRGRLLWKSEFYRTNEEGGENRLAFYTQPSWRLHDKWTVFYRFDYNDPGSERGIEIENVFGVNFQATEHVRLRAAYTHGRFHDPSQSSDMINLSVTYGF